MVGRSSVLEVRWKVRVFTWKFIGRLEMGIRWGCRREVEIYWFMSGK